MNTTEPVSTGMPDTADIGRRAAEAKDRLQHVVSTVTSGDGAATVTVNVSGALQQLSFGPKADEMPRAKLAETIVAAAHRAQAQAAQQLTAIMAPLIGTDSDAMKFLEEQIPAPEVEEEPPAPEQPRWELNTEQQEQPAPPPPAPPARPARPRPPVDEEDDYYGDSILRRGL
ncbi:YbaB/EbfC family nucleoid-associated protein [Amycolatopsis sp. H20-H5]|uniref:YbaB/EbfC family nucleoid-associated protein n=1 Tax=Amycolatopsis sp. H20-H5 TaxID=3046309 RepID=UPI002DB816E5|nr:YbaB/EbfC family nucleoid-associated protein [Amycolatopsis sp. H20-H5]MEC3977221.1 YbaB/EbfC family nucleoid-associated protein [Amycolatopsis sp. H20-H5]